MNDFFFFNFSFVVSLVWFARLFVCLFCACIWRRNGVRVWMGNLVATPVFGGFLDGLVAVVDVAVPRAEKLQGGEEELCRERGRAK